MAYVNEYTAIPCVNENHSLRKVSAMETLINQNWKSFLQFQNSIIYVHIYLDDSNYRHRGALKNPMAGVLVK